MHPRSTNKPTQAALKLPILESLAAAGGSARAADVATTLAQRFALPSAITSERIICADGRPTVLWDRHVRFAKEKLKADGLVCSGDRGTWQLTDEGREALRQRRHGIVVTLAYRDDGTLLGAQFEVVGTIPTVHTLAQADARDLSFIDSGSIGLCITSPPYADLIRYDDVPGQLGHIDSYEDFLAAMDAVGAEIYRVLKPGGHAAIVAGDVLRSRRQYGEHQVLPLTDDLRSRWRRSHGFRVLNYITWQKLSTIRYENGSGGRLGQPGMPNSPVKLESERILLFRKPGPYTAFSREIRELSRISDGEYARWYRPIWNDIPGARKTELHPAPFPVELPRRLIRMFSYAGETVLDPMAGTFATTKAAALQDTRRNSIASDVVPLYVEEAVRDLRRELPTALAA